MDIESKFLHEISHVRLIRLCEICIIQSEEKVVQSECKLFS